MIKLFDYRRRPLRAPSESHADDDERAHGAPKSWPPLLSSIALATLAVAAIPQPAAAGTGPTVKLHASPENVESGGSSTLTWSSSGATSCTAAGDWSGTLATSGSKSSGALTSAQTFRLTCTGSGGSTTDSLTVYLSDEVPKVSFSASPTTVQQGGSSTLSWSSTNAAFCHGYGPWDSVEPASGSSTTNGLTATTTYTLTCFNGSSSGAKTSVKATVTVSSGGSTGAATLTWTPPTLNTNGTPVTALAGYTIYYGTSESSMSKSLVVSGAASSSAEISGLTDGTWYFAVAANATDGTQSAASNIGSVAI